MITTEDLARAVFLEPLPPKEPAHRALCAAELPGCADEPQPVCLGIAKQPKRRGKVRVIRRGVCVW